MGTDVAMAVVVPKHFRFPVRGALIASPELVSKYKQSELGPVWMAKRALGALMD